MIHWERPGTFHEPLRFNSQTTLLTHACQVCTMTQQGFKNIVDGDGDGARWCHLGEWNCKSSSNASTRLVFFGENLSFCVVYLGQLNHKWEKSSGHCSYDIRYSILCMVFIKLAMFFVIVTAPTFMVSLSCRRLAFVSFMQSKPFISNQMSLHSLSIRFVLEYLVMSLSKVPPSDLPSSSSGYMVPILAGLCLSLFGGCRKHAGNDQLVPIRGDIHVLVVGKSTLTLTPMSRSPSHFEKTGDPGLGKFWTHKW